MLFIQESFEFDKLSGAEIYEIILQSTDSFLSLNQTNTSYYETKLIPGLRYNITITAIGSRRRSEQIVKDFATSDYYLNITIYRI